ncbi:MAG: hypothetical protein KAH01_02040, partial [Caldisericia bacterium]|nr:hypothetical protein [Caldisericia bacterium]
MNNFLKNSNGQTLVEYGLIIGAFALIIVATVPAFRSSVQTVFATTKTDFYMPVGELNPAEEPDPGEDPEDPGWFPPQLGLDDDNTLYAFGDITLTGSSRIIGNIVTNGDVITEGTAHVEGVTTTYAGYPYNFPLPVFPDIQGSSYPDKGDFIAPWWPPLTEPITEDAYYHNFTVEKSVVIDTGNEGDVITIVVDHFDSGGTGKITLEGEGKLIFVINDTFEFNGDSEFNAGGSEESLLFLYKGEEVFHFGGDQEFSGSIYIEKADLVLEGSASDAGNIIVGGDNVELTGAADLGHSLLYAPLAELNLENSASAIGKIVAKTVNILGDSVISFSQVSVSENFYWDPYLT